MRKAYQHSRACQVLYAIKFDDSFVKIHRVHSIPVVGFPTEDYAARASNKDEGEMA
jgi:hypothetical protein